MIARPEFQDGPPTPSTKFEMSISAIDDCICNTLTSDVSRTQEILIFGEISQDWRYFGDLRFLTHEISSGICHIDQRDLTYYNH